MSAHTVPRATETVLREPLARDGRPRNVSAAPRRVTIAQIAAADRALGSDGVQGPQRQTRRLCPNSHARTERPR